MKIDDGYYPYEHGCMAGQAVGHASISECMSGRAEDLAAFCGILGRHARRFELCLAHPSLE